MQHWKQPRIWNTAGARNHHVPHRTPARFASTATTTQIPCVWAGVGRQAGREFAYLYRDIQTLQNQGANIEGEAGIGYVLRDGYLMPPLMLTEQEVEALVLGEAGSEVYGALSTLQSQNFKAGLAIAKPSLRLLKPVTVI